MLQLVGNAGRPITAGNPINAYNSANLTNVIVYLRAALWPNSVRFIFVLRLNLANLDNVSNYDSRWVAHTACPLPAALDFVSAVIATCNLASLKGRPILHRHADRVAVLLFPAGPCCLVFLGFAWMPTLRRSYVTPSGWANVAFSEPLSLPHVLPEHPRPTTLRTAICQCPG